MRVMALSVVCFMAGGCGNLTLSKPSASFRSMSIEDVSGRGFTMNVDIDVRNPNSVALPLGAVAYSLGLGGVEVSDPFHHGDAEASRRRGAGAPRSSCDTILAAPGRGGTPPEP